MIFSFTKNLSFDLRDVKNLAYLFIFKSLLILFVQFTFISCSSLLRDTASKSTDSSIRPSNDNLKEVISKARFDVDNINIYMNPNEYLEKIISTRGIFVEQKFIKEKDLKFVITGSNNGQPAEFIVYLDHPLQKQSKINENVQVISTASGIRVFGRLKGLEEYLTYDGIKKQLPVLEAIAIFYLEDRDFKYPVWVNLLYEQ